jgi:hypothetical protein
MNQGEMGGQDDSSIDSDDDELGLIFNWPGVTMSLITQSF